MLIKPFALTLLALVLTLLAFHWLRIDLWLQDYFYNVELHQWLLDREQKLAKLLLYDGIKQVYIVVVLLLASLIIFGRKQALVQIYQPGLNIVLLSCLLVPLVVGGLKAITNVPCPRDIVRYNGDQPDVTVLQSYPDNFSQRERQRCFPAAHASGGFALMSLFFLFRQKNNKRLALTAALGLGWLTGFYKMLIGDHFLSHTVVSMLLAWLIILVIAKIFLREKKTL